MVAPEYTVEIVSLPTGRLEVVTLATPFVMVPVPSDVDPLMNVTVPVGVPVPGLTTTTVVLDRYRLAEHRRGRSRADGRRC